MSDRGIVLEVPNLGLLEPRRQRTNEFMLGRYRIAGGRHSVSKRREAAGMRRNDDPDAACILCLLEGLAEGRIDFPQLVWSSQPTPPEDAHHEHNKTVERD
jgi:hypothetical protein